MTHPVRQPTRPLSGLAATFKITRGTAAHIYNCRFCPARFEFLPATGGLRGMTPEERDLIYAHVTLHESSADDPRHPAHHRAAPARAADVPMTTTLATVYEHSAVCKECGEVLNQELIADGKPTPAGWREIGRRLAAPVPTRTFDAGKRGRFEFITARQVQARLDQVVGPGNWSTNVQIIRSEHPVSALVELCNFGVKKADVGYSNNPDADDPEDKSYEQEPLKAAVSDRFKRAAVQWGVGRWLYREMRT